MSIPLLLNKLEKLDLDKISRVELVKLFREYTVWNLRTCMDTAILLMSLRKKALEERTDRKGVE